MSRVAGWIDACDGAAEVLGEAAFERPRVGLPGAVLAGLLDASELAFDQARLCGANRFRNL